MVIIFVLFCFIIFFILCNFTASYLPFSFDIFSAYMHVSFILFVLLFTLSAFMVFWMIIYSGSLVSVFLANSCRLFDTVCQLHERKGVEPVGKCVPCYPQVRFF